MELVPVVVAADVTLSVQGPGIERIDPPLAENPYQLIPVLQEIPEPNIAFSGSLNFGAISVDANGVIEPPVPQTITVTVSNLDGSCGDWKLNLIADALGGADGSTIGSDTLVLVSVNYMAVDEAVCSLATNCVVATIESGPQAEATRSFALAMTLRLPDQLGATTFNSTLIATMAREPS